MPQKSWAVGEEVLATDFNTFVQNQVVPAFGNVGTRDSQYTAPPNGALCVTTDTNTLWQRISGIWQRQGSGNLMGSAWSTTDTSIAPSALLPIAVAFTSVALHKYLYIAECGYGQAAGTGGGASQIVRDNGTDVVSRSFTFPTGNAFVGITTMAIVTAPTTAAHSVQVFGTCSSPAPGLSFQDGTLMVVDLGLP